MLLPFIFKTTEQEKKKGHIAWVEKEVLEYAFPVEGVTEAKLLRK